MGVGVPQGLERAVFELSDLVDGFREEADLFLLQLDFRNAFNTVSREAIFDAVRAQLPELSAFVEFLYDDPAFLFFGTDTLLSSSGVQQGDPLGPLLFALAIHPLLLALTANFPFLQYNKWYLDDGGVVACSSVLGKVIDFVEVESAKIGLELNKLKCNLWWHNIHAGSAPVISSEVKRVVDGGICCLGSPIGSEDFLTQRHRKVISEIGGLLERIRDLEDPQTEIILLRSSAGMPRYNHLMRTAAPHLIHEATALYDELVNRFLADMLGFQDFHCLTEATRLEMALPVRLGGLGIGHAMTTSHCAYLGARVQYARCQGNEELKATTKTMLDLFLQTLTSIPFPPEKVEQVFNSAHPQHALVDTVHLSLKESLLSRSSGSDRQRLLSNLEGKAHWLDVVPGFMSSHTMAPSHYRLALRYWFGLQIYPRDSPCSECRKGPDAQKVISDRFGLHFARCPSNNASIHHKMCKKIVDTMRESRLSVQLEAFGLDQDSNRRPADFLFFPDDGSPAICFDFTVVTYAEPYGIDLRQKAKQRKYADFQRNNADSYKFIPVVSNSLGRFGEGMMKLVDIIAASQAELSNSDKKSHIIGLMKLFQFTLMKSIGSSLAATRSLDPSDFSSSRV